MGKRKIYELLYHASSLVGTDPDDVQKLLIAALVEVHPLSEEMLKDSIDTWTRIK